MSAPASPWARLLPTRGLGPLDPIAVVVVAAFSAFASGSQPWTGSNSPDSEFYATLALFGHEVTDRAIEPGYYWTRLGYIAPVRVLTTLFGPWTGFGAWRFVLTLFIAFGIYWMVLRYGNRALAAVAALLVTTNTMVLSYLGNTYVTATVMAATIMLLACGCWAIAPTRSGPEVHLRSVLPAATSGALVGWLAMLNPYGCMLALALWLGIRTVGLVGQPAHRWVRLRRDIVAAVVGAAVVFAAFLVVGRVMFREFEWFRTYVTWNNRLNQADFASDPSVWQTDVALLVPATAIAVALVVGLLRRWSRPSVLSLVIAAVNAAFALGYITVVPGPTLESSYYIAMLWPGALASLALACTALMPGAVSRSTSLLILAIGGIGLWLAIRAGHSQLPFPWAEAAPWLAAELGLTALAATFARTETRAWIGALLGVAALSLILVTAQYLQNGRGFIGWFSQFPFASAYVDFGVGRDTETKVLVQQWLLDETSPEDRIALWTDPDRLLSAVAAMQLWGADNLVTSQPVLNQGDIARLEQMRPTVIALYAPSREMIEVFYASLPAWSQPSPLECIDVALTDPRVAASSACLTRLTWLP